MASESKKKDIELESFRFMPGQGIRSVVLRDLKDRGNSAEALGNETHHIDGHAIIACYMTTNASDGTYDTVYLIETCVGDELQYSKHHVTDTPPYSGTEIASAVEFERERKAIPGTAQFSFVQTTVAEKNEYLKALAAEKTTQDGVSEVSDLYQQIEKRFISVETPRRQAEPEEPTHTCRLGPGCSYQ